uniref:Uncharacterized protein n=1 Tax=Toxoplasma gondii (strain ATCC 50861 / VEG) TaxID=432359 RepID=A0A0F7UT36_TOXGV|nr:TPA: hypothetical protein BN1205_056550 [Toxoplasma gondii VEG]
MGMVPHWCLRVRRRLTVSLKVVQDRYLFYVCGVRGSANCILRRTSRVIYCSMTFHECHLFMASQRTHRYASLRGHGLLLDFSILLTRLDPEHAGGRSLPVLSQPR